MTKRAKISLDAKCNPKKGYQKFVGVDGYAWNNDHAFSDNLDDWLYGKYRRITNKKTKPLF